MFHRGLSLEALPEIRGADAVLIDGDHNWYTVYNELKTIARVAAEEGKPFPLTLMHDVEFPYADRDMYYFPDTIPEEYRQPTGGRDGDGRSRAGERRRPGRGIANALTAGGPHNGVKTAIDDFLAEVEAPVFLHERDRVLRAGRPVRRAPAGAASPAARADRASWTPPSG